MYKCWLDYNMTGMKHGEEAWVYGNQIYVDKALENEEVVLTSIDELKSLCKAMTGKVLEVVNEKVAMPCIELAISSAIDLKKEGYCVEEKDGKVQITGHDVNGLLYGVYKFITLVRMGEALTGKKLVSAPKNELRMIDQWDNMDGSIERGYSGQSIFYKDNQIVKDKSRIRDYARLLASTGINAISINNVNVHYYETKLITDEYLSEVAEVAAAFRKYGITLFLCVNFAAPMQLAGMSTADPLDEGVKAWWKEAAARVYKYIPDFGGFLVKADSENRPGPFTYNRTQADGANMLADALAPFNGLLIWRCFVYNCHVNWRDRTTDRARAAYDHFKELDGQFKDNVILQIKNGPMDFQIREPLSPLLGGLKATNQMMEFQIAQEYTGQQIHICYLIPMWKECLDFDTYANGEKTYIKDIVSKEAFGNPHGGISAVSNIGDDACWCGGPMAAANLYGFGRLCWDPELSAKEIAVEWTRLTLDLDKELEDKVVSILLDSRKAYEDYTVPLGIGWMVNPERHYGPSVDGYEYSQWGTYHYADWKGIGVDRTMATGTGYTGQYYEPNRSMYENIETCPEELLLFFHHVGYDYTLKDGRTLLQYIYDVHFDGVERVDEYIEKWASLAGHVEEGLYNLVKERLDIQKRDAEEWRDVVNTYFYRRLGIKDTKGRKIYE